ncbi:MAG: T9SS type A sorting domain-containing protein [Candidatus Cloacimonetes bacterium]|nr:T9SS type A sorting domain-containing protein [Candidatus Cloacimonadota bacterium]
MKRLLTVFCLFSSLYMYAQETNLWTNIRHSSYTLNNEIHIRSEIFPLVDSITRFYYSQGENWLSQELISVNDLTYDAIIPVNPDDIVLCRYRTSIGNGFDDLDDIIPGLPDSLVVMMSGYILNDSFPPAMNELAMVAEDDVGDIADGFPEYLDITAQYFSHSESRFYTAISNNSISFPTGPILGPYNVYASLIINPETVLIDSVFYAMVYGQIPVVLTPGLYRFAGLSIDAISRIGNIEHHIDQNNLIMSCFKEDLTTDPYFGEWPNTTNSLLFVPLTMQISLSMESEFVDIGQPAMMVIDQYIVEPFENILPGLFDIEIEDLITVTTINLTYYDTNGNFPLISEVVLDNESVYQFQPQSLDFTEPVNFSTLFSEQWSNGVIRFSDNGYEMVEYLIYSNIDDQIISPNINAYITVYPNPFNPSKESNYLKIELKNLERSPDSYLDIFDIKGRLIYKWGEETTNGSTDEYFWNGRDLQGRVVGSGVYFIRYRDDHTKQFLQNKLLIIK